MGSSLLRVQSSAPGYSLLGFISAGIFRSPNYFGSKLGGQMMSSAVNPGEGSPSCWSTNSPSRISPWLTLPATFEGGDMIYNFYSIVENKVVSHKKRGGGGGGEESAETPDDDAVLVGSSHGWLASFNQRNNDLFLSNPLTGRHIKLPPIHTLPDPQINLRGGRGSVSKLIISCSPNKEEECRAMMTFGPGDRLAFCLPGRSAEWTPIGEIFFGKYTVDPKSYFSYGRAYEDIVYCSKHEMFSCITQFEFDLEGWHLGYPIELDEWDVRDSCSPRGWACRWPPGMPFYYDYEACNWVKANMELLKSCSQISHLVFSEQCDQVFIVVRFVMQQNTVPDGFFVEKSYVDGLNGHEIYGGRLIDMYPYKTVGFSVFKYDRTIRRMTLVNDGSSLDGLAMFIGMNHSFAVSAAEFPELKLKPNAIYFTDANRHRTPGGSICGGHDVGIFSYENKSFSRFSSYPCDVQCLQKNVPPPMWFYPSLE